MSTSQIEKSAILELVGCLMGASESIHFVYGTMNFMSIGKEKGSLGN